MAARDVRVAQHALGVLRAADRRPGPLEYIAPVAEGDDRACGDGRDLPASRLRVGCGADRRVDHRVALLALRRWRPLTGRGLYQPGLDPELAEAQAPVGLELDLGTGQ